LILRRIRAGGDRAAVDLVDGVTDRRRDPPAIVGQPLQVAALALGGQLLGLADLAAGVLLDQAVVVRRACSL
jgi:hypothetical protein